MRQGAYRKYLLGLLTVILLFNYVDRLALGIVLQDVKADLQLSDTQLGFLSGIAFALFYSVMGIPIARWADRGNRVTIISLTAVLWSLMVALCGTAATFGQLLVIRMGVAVGEAGCIPPAFSLIADYFSRAERPRATAIYGMGASLSLVVGFFAAGWLNELYGWRLTFMLLGAPGLVLALLAWSTLQEPRRASSSGTVANLEITTGRSQWQPSLTNVCAILWRNRTFRNLLLCQAVLFFFNNGMGLWLPTFFVRSYGLSTGEIGTWLAASWGLGGLFGAYLGGDLASRHAPNNERLQLLGTAMALSCCAVLLGIVCLVPGPYFAFALMGLLSVSLNACNGPLFATIQTLLPDRIRAVSLALVYLVANLVGMGLGPLATGVLSDYLAPWVGAESVRYALLILAPGFFWSAWYAWRASRYADQDLHEAHAAIEGGTYTQNDSTGDPAGHNYIDSSGALR